MTADFWPACMGTTLAGSGLCLFHELKTFSVLISLALPFSRLLSLDLPPLNQNSQIMSLWPSLSYLIWAPDSFHFLAFKWSFFCSFFFVFSFIVCSLSLFTAYLFASLINITMAALNTFPWSEFHSQAMEIFCLPMYCYVYRFFEPFKGHFHLHWGTKSTVNICHWIVLFVSEKPNCNQYRRQYNTCI